MVSLKDLGRSLALITGGSSGIGLATARALTSKGCSVILLARDQRKLKEAAAGLDGVVGTYAVDVSRMDEVEEVSSAIFKEYGPPNLIINSAGIVYPGTLAELTEEQIDSTIEVDLKGTINVCRAFSPHLSPPAHIVNISSMAGVIGLYGYTAYSAAKFGVWGFSEALRMEMKRKGIGVSVIFPPDTATPQLEFEDRMKPRELKDISGIIRPISAEKVARSILSAIVSGEFMVFPNASSSAVYHANRLAGPIMRRYLDSRIKGSSQGQNGGRNDG